MHYETLQPSQRWVAETPKASRRYRGDVFVARVDQSTLAVYLEFLCRESAWKARWPWRLSENSVLGAARLQAPCPALPCIAVSLRIRLLRAPWSGRFRSGFGLRVNFQTISNTVFIRRPSFLLQRASEGGIASCNPSKSAYFTGFLNMHENMHESMHERPERRG